MQKLAIAAASVCLLLAPGCLSEPSRAKAEREARTLETDPSIDPERVIAEVNGWKLTRGDYYRRILRKFGTVKMLSGMIKEELFLQEAKSRRIDVKPEELEARVGDLIAEDAASVGGEDKLKEIYRAQGMTLEDLRREVAADVQRQLLIQKVIQSLRRVDGDALRAYYQRTYAKSRHRIRQIAYAYPPSGLPEVELARRKIEAREKAERSAKRIREGADFATIARQEGEDATAPAGGDLGLISPDDIPDPVMKAAVLNLKPMEVSDPVDNSLMGAYHVIQVTEITPHKSFAECEEAMKKEILDQPPDERELVDALNALGTKAQIQMFGQQIQVRESEAAEKDGKK